MESVNDKFHNEFEGNNKKILEPCKSTTLTDQDIFTLNGYTSNSNNKLLEEENNSKTDELRSVSITATLTPEQILQFQHFNLRYYEDRYCVTFNTDEENFDIMLRIHTNKLILISIAKGHDIFRKKYFIEHINFNVKSKNLSNIKLSGKKKAGAQKLFSNSILCYLKCESIDQEYPVRVGYTSSLIELNENVIKEPNLLKTDYKGLGYIGILYPNLADKNSTNNLLSEDEYEKYLETRKSLCISH